jgi:hypothetical protein
MPISRSPYLLYLANASGVFALSLGVNALFNPRGALAMWGFPHPGAVPSPPSSSSASAKEIIDTPEGKLAESLMMLYGSRTSALGVALLSTSYWGSHRACTAVVWCSTFIAFMDGFVSLRQIGGGQWNHWGFVSQVLGSCAFGKGL